MTLTPLIATRAEQILKLGRLSMASERVGAIHSLTLDGEIDIANAAKVESELRRIEQTDADVILIDLADVSFIDSTGVRVLITAARRSRESSRLVLQSASPRVMRVLDLAGVAHLLPLCG